MTEPNEYEYVYPAHDSFCHCDECKAGDAWLNAMLERTGRGY